MSRIVSGRGDAQILENRASRGVNFRGDRIGQQERLGFSQKKIRTLDLDLSTERIDEEIQVSGTFIMIVDAWQTSDKTIANRDSFIEIRLDSLSNDSLTMRSGILFSGIVFDKIFVSNVTQADATIQILIITDSPGDRVDADS